MKVTQAQLKDMERNGAVVTRPDKPAPKSEGAGIHIDVPIDEVVQRIEALEQTLLPKIAEHDERLVQFISDTFTKLKAHDDNTNGHRDEILKALDELDFEMELPESVDYGPKIDALIKLVAANQAAVEQMAAAMASRPQIDEWSLTVERDQSVEGEYKPITHISMKAVR